MENHKQIKEIEKKLEEINKAYEYTMKCINRSYEVEKDVLVKELWELKNSEAEE